MMSAKSFRCVSRTTIVVLIVSALLSGQKAQAEENGVTAEQMQEWRSATFGMFVHWGAYACLAGVWDGERVHGYSEHIMRSMEIPLAEYKEKVVANFNPEKFDAEEWVQIAKAAGMRYIVITAKHHDGFAMWDSQSTNYDIIDSTAFGRDPLRELREATRKAGLLFGFYYSHAQDWSHPYGQRNSRDFGYEQPQKRRWWEQPEWSEYVEKSWLYVNGKSIPQMEELITAYDPDIMWFDTHNWLPKELTQVIVERAKELKPDLIINSRGTPDIKDYTNTNDRPEYFQRTNIEYWEGIPTTNDSYGYHAYDKSHKPVSFFVHLIIRAAARGGNLLMNVGPMGNGEVDPIDVNILKGIGKWLIPNGESIYGVERTPLAIQGWGDTTVSGNKLYLHVMDWPDSGELVVGGLETKVNKARFLTENDAAFLDFRRLNDLDVAITIPRRAPETLSNVIELELNGPPVAEKTILLDPAVSSNMLHVFEGELHGNGMQWGGGNIKSNFIQSWPSPEHYISWSVRSNESERYLVTARYTGMKQNIGNVYTVTIADQSLNGTVETIGKHLVIELGEVVVPRGHHTLTVKAKVQKPGSNLVNLTDISFVPVR